MSFFFAKYDVFGTYWTNDLVVTKQATAESSDKQLIMMTLYLHACFLAETSSTLTYSASKLEIELEVLALLAPTLIGYLD